MKKLLVTGASGFLGWNVCRFPQNRWRVIGTYHNRPGGIFPKTEAYRVNLQDKDQTWRLLKNLKPDAVLHLAAYSDVGFCEENPAMTWKLNVEATAQLAEMCEDRHIRLLFTSSEQVFDGSKESYSEADIPTPANEYGRQKVEAEKCIQERMQEAAIVRIAVLFGKSNEISKSFLQQWLETWQAFLPVTAFYDEYRSFLSARSAAEGLFLLLDQGAAGIFHLGGEEAMSRYDFARLAKHIFDLHYGNIIARSQREVKTSAFRPPKLALDTRKIRNTGYHPQHPAPELKALVKEILLPPGFSEN